MEVKGQFRKVLGYRVSAIPVVIGGECQYWTCVYDGRQLEHGLKFSGAEQVFCHIEACLMANRHPQRVTKVLTWAGNKVSEL